MKSGGGEGVWVREKRRVRLGLAVGRIWRRVGAEGSFPAGMLITALAVSFEMVIHAG